MGIVREISPELDPVEFPDNMDEAAVDAFMAQRGRELRQGLIARRQAQLAAETEGDEALRYASGEMPLSERVISTVMSAPQSAMRQTGQTLRGLGEFLATAPIPRERGEIAPEIVRENIRRAQRTPAQVERDVEASPTRRLGGDMVAAAPEAFPTLPGVRESLPSQVSGGIGSVGALLPAGLTGPAAPFVGGAMYGLSAGEDFADDAEQVINSRIAEALAQGDTSLAADLERRKFDMKNTARMAGRAIGAGTEGVLGLAGKIRVGKSQIGGIGAKLAERMVPKTAPVAVQNAVRGAVEGGLTEAAQEGTEQILGNAAALAVYDPNRGIMDDVAQSVLVGGLTGKVVGGAFGSRGQNRDPLPESRAAVAGEVVPGTEIPQDIGAPDLTLEDLGDLLPVEEVVAPVPEPPVPQAQTEGLAQIDRSGTPVPATQETPENMGISRGTPVPEALVEPAPETPALGVTEKRYANWRDAQGRDADGNYRISLPPRRPAPEAPAVDSPTLSPATAAETPTAPETPASPEPSSFVEGVTGEKPKRTRKAKRVAGVAPAPVATVDPANDEQLGINERGDPIYWSERARTHYSIQDGRVQTAPWVEGLPDAAKQRLVDLYTNASGVAPAPTPAIPPDDTAMEAATAAAMAPGAPAPITTAPDEGIAERAAVDDEMTRATTRVPEVATAQVGMPDEGIAGKPEPTIPPLPTELAEAIAADEAPDVFVENTVRKFGESERASAQSTKPNERQRQVIEQGKRIAAEKGWDWNKVKETARRQLGLNENFLKPDSRADQVFKMMREEDAAAAKRGQRTAEEMARIDAETKARRNKEASGKAEKEAAQRRQAEEKAAETERQTAQEHDQIVAKLPKKWMASWKKAKTKKAKAKLLNEAMVASGTRNEAALTAALDRAQEPTITEAPAAEPAVAQAAEEVKPAAPKPTTRTLEDRELAARKRFETIRFPSLGGGISAKKADERRQKYNREREAAKAEWDKARQALSDRYAENEQEEQRQIQEEIDRQRKEDEAEFAKEGKLTQEQRLDLSELGLAVQKKKLGVLSEARLAWLESKASAQAAQTDILERALNAAIKATDPGSSSFSDAFLIGAVGMSTINAALRIVRRVYLKTRDLARAKRQGMRLIRRQLRTDPKADLPRIEEAFSQLVDGTAEKPGPDQIEAFQAADGSRRQKSRGLFTGDVTVDTDAEWQAGAERWINQFNGNIRRAFEAARSTDYATTGLNPAAQDYVFGRLLELTEIQANAARNDVDALRALNLQKEITDASRLASSEAGKALGARALVQNRILWMFPVLSYRNLIREAQKRLPFPDVVADEVRTWLQESGRRAVQEMRNAMTDADKVFARELKTTVRDMRVVWRDVMTASVESQEAMRRKILEELVKAPELKGLSRQGYIDIANLLGKAWERERARIFAAEFRKQVPLPTVKEDVRRKLFTAIPDILKWANLGLLDNEAFRNAVAPKFGVAKFDGETAKKLNTMAQQAQRVGGVNRNRIIAEMYDTMQREGGVRWPDIVRDYWYAAVLGAVNTQVDNALGVINGALNTVMGMAMSPPEVRKAMGKAYREGFGEAIADFFPILWRGDVARAINFNPEQPANTLNALSKSGNLFARGLSVGKYVSRLMTALDQVNALSTDQAMKAYALGRRLPIEHARRYMMPSENVLRTARLKAEAEGTPPNLMRKRVREIVQESIPVEVLISSKDIRELVTFTNQPKGLMGALYRGVQEMEKKAPGFKVLSGTNFLRFAANYSNEILNYVAPVALYRYYFSAPSRADGRLGLKMGQEERQLILAKLAVGTALGTFAAALFLGDDDDEKDRKIDITGSFKSLDPNKRKQLLSEGRAPYSIRIGDKYVSYRQLPFGGVLGAIGELRDRQLYNPKEWNQESIARKFVDGAFAGSLIVRDSPAISSFTEFLGTANAYKYDMNEQVEKSLPKYIARLGGSFIPRIAKEIDAWADPAIYKANTGHEFFLQQMPIFRRELGEGPVLNVLGEPVQVERYPWSRWIRTRKEDKAWSTLGELASKGVFLPVPSVTVKVMENGKRREMTPAESYRYQQRVGQAYRKFVEDNAERLLRMKPDEATDFIDTQTERIRSRIRAGGA